MKRTWKPGDIASVRNEHGIWNRAIRVVGIPHDFWQYGVSQSTAPADAEAQPLVVIDPEASRAEAVEIVQRVCSALNTAPGRDISAGIRAAQDAIRSFLAPEPDEGPGSLAEVLGQILDRLDRLEGKKP